jgi:esterase/lipase superfamily enzyme
MPFFMMNNRAIDDSGTPGKKRADAMSYYVANDSDVKKLTQFKVWKSVTSVEFGAALVKVASGFPSFSDEDNELQKHVSLFIHGYNNDWQDSVNRYADLYKRLYAEPDSLGVLILYTWPSDGSVASYLPDREDARNSAPALANALVDLHTHILTMQRFAAQKNDIKKQCRAKISVISHSMGNFVMQNALAIAAKKLNSPQLITLIHQLVMVAADVDNDIFQKEKPDDSDGHLMSNLCYRIAALYTGLDAVLGASAGLKHFGTRRLGRSGLADRDGVWDNVFDLDVTNLIEKNNIHSAVFESEDSVNLLRQILIGVDRHFLPKV